MAITRWDRLREVVALQNRVNSLFRDLNEADAPVAAASFAPAVDIYEDAEKIVLKLEVPGIEEKDLDIRVENHTLTVKGERKFEAEEKEQKFHRIERRYGSFFRAFTLPTTVDTENVQASYNAGVLKLELPRRRKRSPGRSRSMSTLRKKWKSARRSKSQNWRGCAKAVRSGQFTVRSFLQPGGSLDFPPAVLRWILEIAN